MMDDFHGGAIPASGVDLGFSQEASQRRAWSRKEDDARRPRPRRKDRDSERESEEAPMFSFGPS